MSPVSLIAFLGCLAIVASSLHKHADVFSPARVFGFVWLFAFGLTDLKWSSLQHEWPLTGWLLLLIGAGSFLLGVFCVYVCQLGGHMMPIARGRVELRRTIAVDERMFMHLIVAVFLFYAVSYAMNASIKGQIPWFSRTPGPSRVGYGVFALGLILHAAPSIMFFVVQYWIFCSPGVRSKALLGTVFFVTGASYFLLLHRFDLAIWIVVTLVLLYYVTTKINLRTLIFSSSVILVLYAWMQSIRLVGTIQNFLFYSSQMRISIRYAPITEPYMYVVTNLENFVRASRLLDHHTYGYYTFNAIMSLSGLKHWLADYFRLDDTPYLTSGYNTYSFLWVFYRDYGVVGLAVVPFLLGAVIAVLYYRMRSRPSLPLISVYGMAVFVMLISFFHNAFSLLHFVFNTALVFAVTSAVTRSAPPITTSSAGTATRVGPP